MRPRKPALENVRTLVAANKATNSIERTYADCYLTYQQRLREANALDFDDLIMMTVHLFQAFPDVREGYRRRGSDPDRLIDTCIEMDNAVIGDHPGVTFGLHICRGNNQSMFYASGGYEPIAERVFRRARFQRFLLEYDDERSGSFAPLRAVPDDRTVVLGLATTKKPRLETVEELAGRIEAAAQIVPLERLALSPQCGFASTLEGNRIPPETQRRKLEVVAATARAVWRS